MLCTCLICPHLAQNLSAKSKPGGRWSWLKRIILFVIVEAFSRLRCVDNPQNPADIRQHKPRHSCFRLTVLPRPPEFLIPSDSIPGRKPIYLNAAALEIIASPPHINSFIIPSSKPGKPRCNLQRVGMTTAAAGLDSVRLHDLRHSFASIGAGASMGLPVIGKLLGHSQAATTARYAHFGFGSHAPNLRNYRKHHQRSHDQKARRRSPANQAASQIASIKVEDLNAENGRYPLQPFLEVESRGQTRTR